MNENRRFPLIGKRELQAIYRTNFGAFAQRAFVELLPAIPYRHNWHIDALGWHLMEVLEGRIKRLVITVPPRSLKSHCASVAFPAFSLGRYPSHRFICVSYSNDLAVEHANAFRKIVHAHWYTELFPAMQVDPRKDKETELRTTLNGFRMATTPGGSLTGRGGQTVIIDDPSRLLMPCRQLHATA